MKRTDFKKGRRGFVVRTFGHIGCPLDIFIEEVKVIGIVDGCPAVWDVVNEESLFVSDLRDVFLCTGDITTRLHPGLPVRTHY